MNNLSTANLQPLDAKNEARRFSKVRFSEIMFVDPAVEDWENLVKGIKPGIEAIILDRGRNGVKQISEVLDTRIGITSVHIVSHGSPGSLKLGNAQLNRDNLDKYSSLLQQWRGALDGADLLIYGCNVAFDPNRIQGCQERGEGQGGEVGFIQRIALLTGANVAASAKLIGCAELGGEWELECAIGQIKTPLAFEPAVMANYQDLLADAITRVSVDSDGNQGEGDAAFYSLYTTLTQGKLEHSNFRSVEPKMPTFEGTQEQDFLTGSRFGDIIKAYSGNDTLLGGEGSDLLWGNRGNDDINGEQDNDTIYAGKDNDSVRGGKGDDQIFGDRDNDVIYGDSGNDTVRGGRDRDRLFGDEGNDVLFGDLSGDILTGGGGCDLFAIGRVNNGVTDIFTGGTNLSDADVITDFDLECDLIGLDGDLTFQDLSIYQGSGDLANDAVIQDRLTGEYLAILKGVNSSEITASKFTSELTSISSISDTPTPTPSNTPTPSDTPTPTPTPTPSDTPTPTPAPTPTPTPTPAPTPTPSFT
ncbi:DUF4347 domain-containing protein, partial [Microcoleus sp. herbarium19]|uniref:DUF4347 domain-containing protein n=1 Tax=unclassified Microcoleus TaxID=2642155 RepID=UPI002FCE6D8B